MSSSCDGEAIRAASEIARVDLITSKIFDVAKSEPRQIIHQRCRIEEQSKGFTGAGYSLRKCIERQLLDGAEKRSLDGEVECEAAACG